MPCVSRVRVVRAVGPIKAKSGDEEQQREPRHGEQRGYERHEHQRDGGDGRGGDQERQATPEARVDAVRPCPIRSGRNKAKSPSPPMMRPITVVESVKSWRTTGRYVETTVIERASPNVGRPSSASSDGPERSTGQRESGGRRVATRSPSQLDAPGPHSSQVACLAGEPLRRVAGSQWRWTGASTRSCFPSAWSSRRSR